MADNAKWPQVKTWVGANGRVLTFMLVNAYGVPINLSSLTVTIDVLLDGVAVLTDHALDVIDAASGEVALTYGFADDGEHSAQIKATTGGGSIEYSEPCTIVVQKPVHMMVG